MQLFDVQNYPCFQALLFLQNSLDEFWQSSYKSYSMIGVNSIKIILTFTSIWLCEHGFSSLTEIKGKKWEITWNWRQNVGVPDNDENSFQYYLLPKTVTPIALIF